MFAGTASGKLLPCYVVYKAEHLYDTWRQGGRPRGTRYNRSKSGWFDGVIFEDWFNQIPLKYFQKYGRDVPKMLIGDSLASHLSINVINLCKEFNIRFVLLQPNSTHICQPLDVAVFRPLKIYWRQVINKWKMSNRGCIPKDTFPSLLAETLEKLNITIKENLISGFRATGIFPLDEEQVLKRVPRKEPSADASTSTLWSETFADLLSQRRINQNPEKKRKKKLQVQPGLSVAGPSHISSSGEDSDGNNEQFSLHDSESSVGQIDFDDVDMEENREDFDNVDINENREYFDQSDIEEHMTLAKLRDQINK